MIRISIVNKKIIKSVAVHFVPLVKRSDSVKLLFLHIYGALAQLARAFDWQSKGHRFEPGMLHHALFRA